MIKFPTRISDCGSHSPARLDLFPFSDASICSIMAFPSLGNSDCLMLLNFRQTQNRILHGKISCKLDASAAASEFVHGLRLELSLTYHVKSHSSPWFLAACAAAIVHRNHFFRLYRQNKSS